MHYYFASTLESFFLSLISRKISNSLARNFRLDLLVNFRFRSIILLRLWNVFSSHTTPCFCQPPRPLPKEHHLWDQLETSHQNLQHQQNISHDCPVKKRVFSIDNANRHKKFKDSLISVSPERRLIFKLILEILVYDEVF